MTHRILIVDSDESFAVVLKESLEQSGAYRATAVASGDEALQALAADKFDLAIVDLGLTDPDGAKVARTLRQQQADLRLMLIPLMGEELSSELAGLNVQGILPKPFFFPELPGRVADALARPVVGGPGVAESVEPDIASDWLAVLQERIPEIVQEMTRLSREINAEAVMLTCRDRLIAHTGRLSAKEMSGLARAVADSWRTSARVAEILGREQLRFEQSVDGGGHMFYALAVTDDIILSAALRNSVPLGIIRHRAKATADALRVLIHQG